MDSRSLVNKTLTFDNPARIPRQKWILPWAENKYPEVVSRLKTKYPDDLTPAPAVYTIPLNTRGNRYQAGLYVDEWGCMFRNAQDGVIGIVQEPLIKTWDDLEKFKTPEGPLMVDREAVNAFCRGTELFVLAGTVTRPFERMQFLRTMEQSMIDLATEPPELKELLWLIHTHYLKEVEAWARTEVDAISLMDDWGIQNSLMVSPAIFRRLFKPMYADYVKIARHYGKTIFMHSDGYIQDIIEDFIEIGIDAINSQLFCMDIEELGRRYRGRITFWGEIDRQQLLPHGKKEDIQRAVERIQDSLYQDGGVIAQCEFGPGAKPKNVLSVFESWNRWNPTPHTRG